MKKEIGVDLTKFTSEEIYKIFRTAWRHGELTAMKTLLVEIERRNPIEPQDEISFFRGLVAKYEGRFADAIAAFETSMQCNEKRHDSTIELAKLKCYFFEFEQAYKLINDCQGDFSNSPVYLTMAGECLITLGLPDRALPHFERAHNLQPNIHQFAMNLASCLSFVGQSARAVKLLQGVLTDEGGNLARALYQLSTLAPEKCEPFVKAERPSLAPANLDVNLALRLQAEARLNDAKGESEKAWDLYQRAGAVVTKQAADEAMHEVKLLRDATKLAMATNWTLIPNARRAENEPRMIFVLGLPRSGTTLVEQILSAHPDVESVGETNLIARSILKVAGRNLATDRVTGEVLSEATLSHPQGLRKNYLRNIKHLAQNARYAVEKQPFNTVFFPFLLKAFPDARFIFTERHPLATAYSMFKQLFAQAYYSSNRLVDLNIYLQAHRSMMDAWRDQFAGQFIELEYETLVAAPEATIAGMLEKLDIQAHPNVFEHHIHFKQSMTASSQQVQQSIQSSGNLAWQQFADRLTAKIKL